MKLLRIIGYLFGAVFIFGLGFVAFLEFRGIPKYEVDKIDFPQLPFDSAMLRNGEKIASVQCVVCHTGSDGKLSGRLLHEIPQFGEIHSANITQSKEHGIGNWTDADIAYLLRTGCQRSDGQYIPAYMPKFPHMSDYDLKSVIVFLHSGEACVQPSEIPRVASKPNLLVNFLCLVAFKKIPYPTAQVVIPDSTKLVEFGHYLVTGRYDCYPCHSADFKTMNMEFPEKSGGYMGGGNMMIAGNGNTRYTANITMDEQTGIGRWTQEDFANAMLHSKNKDGKTLRNPMLPFNGMTDQEIKAIWAYIQTVPKIKNEVNRDWASE